MRKLVPFALLIAAIATGCSASKTASPANSPSPSLASPPVASPSPTPSASGDVAGTWNGTYESTTSPGANGTFTMVLDLSGGTLSGTITVTDTPCITNGTVDGSVQGSHITFGAVKGAQQTIGFTGTVSGDQMSGTYSAPACGHGAGNWTASRSA